MKRTILFLLIALLPALSWSEDQVITDLLLIGANSSSEINSIADQYTSQGWQSFGYDLNKGCGKNSDYIFLLYKTGSISNKDKAYSFISDVCIYVGKGCPDELVYNDIDYELVPFDGSDNFKSSKGDLNCNAGGAYIHLYCSRQVKATPEYVSSIWFNATSSSSVPGANQSGSIDLNQGAGGSYIYMHCNKVPFGSSIYNEADAERHINLRSVFSNVFFSKGNYHLKDRCNRALRLTFAPGCTVTLDNVRIPYRPTAYSNHAGLTFRGDATINLHGTNEVASSHPNKPAIYVPQGHTLTIKGDGSLVADSHSDIAAGIGGGYEEDCGSIVIEGGDIHAIGRNNACGIGNGANATCGNVFLGWTRETDRIYSSSYPAGKVGFVNGKNFLIEGTDMEASISNINGQSIVPLVESHFCRPWGTREGNYCGKENINGGRNLYYIKLPCPERSDMHTVTIRKNPTVLDTNGDMNDYAQISGAISPWISREIDYDSNGYPHVSIFPDILHVVVEEGVTSIGKNAFFNIYTIQDVTLPSSLTSIAYSAFYSCNGTKDVYCHADPNMLIWDNNGVLDFNHYELKSTKMHVYARYLSRYKEKFGDAIVTFVGDLDDILDGIGNVKADMATDDAWYTLDGMRLNGKPAKPGIYITGGRKVAIK